MKRDSAAGTLYIPAADLRRWAMAQLKACGVPATAASPEIRSIVPNGPVPWTGSLWSRDSRRNCNMAEKPRLPRSVAPVSESTRKRRLGLRVKWRTTRDSNARHDFGRLPHHDAFGVGDGHESLVAGDLGPPGGKTDYRRPFHSANMTHLFPCFSQGRVLSWNP